MSGEDVRAADELEAVRQLKARYCRFLDTKDVEGWRAVFSTDVVVTLDMPVQGVDNFVPMVMGSLENAATMHHCHTPEINDWIIFGDGRELHGAGHYHETYEKRDGSWRIKTLHLWATPVESPNIAAAAMKSRPADTPVSSWGR